MLFAMIALTPAVVDLRSPELQFSGLLVPWNVGIGAIGFLLAWAVVAILERLGLTRFIWYLPLFFLALVVLFASLLGLILQP